MKVIIEIYGVLLMLLLTSAAGISVTAAQEKTAQAKQYHAEAVAEIENSNFNPDVVASCIKGAEESGYTLSVTPQTYDEYHDATTAEVVLGYSYEIPLLGIREARSVRGVAR